MWRSYISALGLGFKMVDQRFTRMTTRERMPSHRITIGANHRSHLFTFPLRARVGILVPREDRPSNAPALQELPLHCLNRCTV